MNLVDFLRTDEPHDLHHSLFPDLSYGEMQKQWEQLSERVVVDLQMKVKAHIDTLYIPDIHEPLLAKIFPDGIHLYLASRIDEEVPEWTIAQKTLVYTVYLHELYNQGKTDLYNRIRDKHNRKLEQLKTRQGSAGL